MRKKIVVIAFVLLCSAFDALAQRPGGDDPPIIDTLDDGALTEIQAYNPTQARTFQRVLTPLRPVTDTAQVTINTPVEQVSVTTKYFDPLGRPIQQVNRHVSPLKRDFVTPVVYNAFGGRTRNYPGYVELSDSASNGRFKPMALVRDSVFYKAAFPYETFIYSEQLTDASPLQRPRKVTEIGDVGTGSGIGKFMDQRSNITADSVRLWTISINNEDDIPVTSQTYLPGSLFINEITDERGVKAIEYKDETGRLILSKIQLSNTPSTGHSGWLCTYYIYDEMDHLRMVIPPKAVDALLALNWNFSGYTNIISGLCYTYFYDTKGRVIVKSIADKGKNYIVYDQLGRIVLTRDPKLNELGQWAFVKYDEQNRSSITGTITLSGAIADIRSQAAASSSYPVLSGSYTILSETYYDDYSWASGGVPVNSSLVTTHINSSNFYTTYNTSPDYAQSIEASKRTRGLATGSKIRVLGTADFLYSLSVYDEDGRLIQSKGTNITGGTDVLTTQYNFAGAILRSHITHEKQGSNAQTHTVLTKNAYDHAGRIVSIKKNVDGLGDQLIVENTYNELNQLKSKIFGDGIDSLLYTYDIRGRKTGINAGYATTGGTDHYFGEALYYENGFGPGQLNGAISGIKWRAGGDNIARGYQFTYDNANRLTAANFSQQNEGSSLWSKDLVDFSVDGLTYDAGSNILSMRQKGLQLGNSTTIDSLIYEYNQYSNQLKKVSDGIANSGQLGDFKDTLHSGDDYAYDANGNITKDYNRKMHSVSDGAGATYNLLDKPDSMAIAGKGTFKYLYDANGIRLKKQIIDNTTGTSVTSSYLYIAGFTYLNDTLQSIQHEEGRVRYARKVSAVTGTNYYAYEFDYYLRDHLNNVRTVLTDGKDTAIYAATMEENRSAAEAALFSYVYDPVNTVRPKPTGFDTDNDNEYVARLNANSTVSKKTGPSLVIKVMAGDQVQINTFSYYNTPTESPGDYPDLLGEILNGLANGVVSGSSGKLASSDLVAVSNALSPGISNFLTNERDYDNSKPKAYLNWILFDNQFKYVASNTGAEQVQPGSSKQPLVAPLQTIAKNGYLYVYVSNESPQDVYFDDITVTHVSGPLLQEQSYYPFGLQMAGISDKAANRLPSAHKFNGGVEAEEEFGINLYSTFYRQYDPQLGRFYGIDIKSEEQAIYSTYQFCGNDPISFNDPLGDKRIQNSQFVSVGNLSNWTDILALITSLMKSGPIVSITGEDGEEIDGLSWHLNGGAGSGGEVDQFGEVIAKILSESRDGIVKTTKVGVQFKTSRDNILTRTEEGPAKFANYALYYEYSVKTYYFSDERIWKWDGAEIDINSVKFTFDEGITSSNGIFEINHFESTILPGEYYDKTSRTFIGGEYITLNGRFITSGGAGPLSFSGKDNGHIVFFTAINYPAGIIPIVRYVTDGTGLLLNGYGH